MKPSISEEHRIVRTSAGKIDLSSRAKIILGGKDRVRFLHGLTTSDIKALKVGEGCYTIITNRLGRMVADIKVMALEDALLLDAENKLRQTIIEYLNKFIVIDDVVVKDVTNEFAQVGVFGPASKDEVAKIFGITIPPLMEFHFAQANHVIISRWLITGEDGYEIFASSDIIPAPPISAETFNILRLENGVPLWGVDMDENNIPTEAGLEAKAISYSKGCYVGQEIIQRIKTYGEVAKHLVGFAMQGNDIPHRGDKIFAGNKEIGEITSAAKSFSLNKVIALGYVKRGHNTIGNKVSIEKSQAEIVPMPFYKSPNL